MRPTARVLAGLLCLGMITAACSSPKPSHSKTLSVTQDQSASTSTSSTSATTATPPSTVNATGACTSVTAAVGQTQGAAGTITGTITLTRLGPGGAGATCTMDGYPSMALRDATGAALPVTIVDGLTVSVSGSANAPPARVTLAPGTQAQFAYQYSDVPSGSETSCPRSTTATITPPSTETASAPAALSIAPCNNGTIRVSPVYLTG